MTTPAELSRPRRAVFEALKVAAPNSFVGELRQRFVDQALVLRIADLDMDSLALMEFCISVELSTGVSLVPAQLAELASTDAIEAWIQERLA